jgi:hypothetical protein
MNSFDSIKSYFGSVSCFWQYLQDLTLLDGMCHTILYFTDVVVSWRLEWLGCKRERCYHLIALSCRDAETIKFHLYVALLRLQ